MATTEPPQEVPSSTAKPVVDVRKEYARLQKELQAGCSYSDTIRLLELLANYRRQIAFLDDPNPAPSQPPPPTPVRDQPSSTAGTGNQTVVVDQRLGRRTTNNQPPSRWSAPAATGKARARTVAATSAGTTGQADDIPRQPTPPLAPEESKNGEDQSTEQTGDKAPRLAIRFLVEGPATTGIGSVADRLRSQFGATATLATARTPGLSVASIEFKAGSFESAPISFQLIAVGGTANRAHRRALRSAVDGIIVVIDPHPSNLGPSTSFVSEVLDDRERVDTNNRPDMVIFAHRSDQPEALEVDDLAAELLTESSIRVIPTTEDGNGLYHGFAVATNAAVRRAQARDDLGLQRTTAIGLNELLGSIGELKDPDLDREPTDRPSEPEASSAGPQPTSPVPLAARPTPKTITDRPTASNETKRAEGAGQTRSRDDGRDDLDAGAGAATNGQGQLGDVVGSSDGAAEASDDDPTANGGRRASALRRLISALRTPDSENPDTGTPDN